MMLDAGVSLQVHTVRHSSIELNMLLVGLQLCVLVSRSRAMCDVMELTLVLETLPRVILQSRRGTGFLTRKYPGYLHFH